MVEQPTDPIIELEEATVKLVIFTLHEQRYGFHGRCIREVLLCSDIYYVPGCPDYLEGVINVRGEIESVLRLTTLLGIADSPVTRHSRILLAKEGDISSGIRVDSVDDVVDIPESHIQPPLATLPFAAGELHWQGQSVIVLDLAALFARLLV